jgi:hypothetical protein
MALPIDRPSGRLGAADRGNVGEHGEIKRENSLTAERDALFRGGKNTTRPKGTEAGSEISRIGNLAKAPAKILRMPTREEQNAEVKGTEFGQKGKYELAQKKSIFSGGFARKIDAIKKITGNQFIDQPDKNFKKVTNLKAKEKLNAELNKFLENNKDSYIKKRDVDKVIRDMNVKETYMSGTERIIKEKFEEKLKDL